jgi:hypothetical protein
MGIELAQLLQQNISNEYRNGEGVYNGLEISYRIVSRKTLVFFKCIIYEQQEFPRLYPYLIINSCHYGSNKDNPTSKMDITFFSSINEK